MEHSELDVGLFEPRDAGGIVELFRTVYGEAYPIRIFYDPDGLIRANETGEYISVVARSASGRVIGVHNLYRSAPYKKLYEWGVGLVYKDYRGQGVSNEIGRFLIEKAVPQADVEELFGEPVCNHVYTQKMCIAHQFVETALEVALMPAEAYVAEKSAQGRTATLLTFRQYIPKPRTVFLPRSYDDALRFIYAGLDEPVVLETASEDIPKDGITLFDTQIFDFAAVSRTAVHEIGADLGNFTDRLEADGQKQGIVVFQLWLKSDKPTIHGAVELLRSRGYFLGGALPRWLDHDGLLMQKILCDPGYDDMKLQTDRARAVRDIVQQDEQRARTLLHG